jgi:hypothetical protein
MGYNLELSQNGKLVHATDLCTNGGYSGLCEWIESLPAGAYPALAALAADGRFVGTDRLVDEIIRALGTEPPADPDVAHVADRLGELLGAGRPNETVSVVP